MYRCFSFITTSSTSMLPISMMMIFVLMMSSSLNSRMIIFCDAAVGSKNTAIKEETSSFGSELWPFDNHKNHSKIHNDTDIDVDKSCAHFTNCTECRNQRLCHWCDDIDNGACHAIGSIHGCVFGSNCDSSDKKKKENDTDVDDKSCAHSTNCTECNNQRLCHWCGDLDTGACHAIGSIHGCVFGSTCGNNDNDNKKDNHNDTCAAHNTCSDCSLSSHLCHWCAHDNACHSIGSIYGCVTGVDCYDNTHCQRKEPEPLPNSRMMDFPPIGLIPLLVLISFCTIILCCSTLCCCTAGCIKGAYDDLLELQEPLLDEQQQPLQQQQQQQETLYAEDTLISSPVQLEEQQPQSADSTADNDEASPPQPDNGDDVAVVVEEQQQEDENNHEEEEKIENTDNIEELEAQQEHLSPDDRVISNDSEYTPLVRNTININQSPQQQIPSTNRRKPRTVQRFYNTCVVCYLLSIITVGTFAYFTLRYFPQKPVHNICNDSVAWKSLVDSMSKMQATADFEILASISNPNHFEVALDMGKGSFYHNDILVGTYVIPPVTVGAMAITDILIIAEFTPEKWQALSISSEYYHGTLVLQVDAEVTIRIPTLFDYTFSAELKHLIVHVNEMSDRHLCACPTWDEARNKTKPPTSKSQQLLITEN